MSKDGKTNMMHSQLPGRPSFRNSAMHAVAIVPLTIPRKKSNTSSGENSNAGDAAAGGTSNSNTTTTQSEKSFHHLLDSLQEFATQGRMAHQRSDNNNPSDDHGSNNRRKWRDESSEITLVLPHSQLTRPGDWRYDATPLKSHDWQSGCQRIRIFDGRPEFSRMAYDRIGSFEPPAGKTKNNDNNSETQTQHKQQPNWKDPWKDLEPHRTTSAVIGILNMRDCRDTRDLWRAEESLIQWARAYAHESDREDVALGAGDNRNILTRLFVFDSFEESLQQRVNLNQTRFQANQLVAFPPLDMGGHTVNGVGTNSQMMVLHWNVVVNDLAVSLFRNVERRIRENDVLGKSMVWNKSQQQQQGGISGSSHGANSSSGGSVAQTTSGGISALPSGHITERTESSVTSGTDDTSQSASSNASLNNIAGMGMGGRLKNAFDSTRKAIANRQDLATSAKGGNAPGVSRQGSESSGGGNAGLDARRKLASAKLVTPLDLDANNDMMTSISARDMEALKRRDLGRREKRSADLSLLAGSPIDAYERYTRSAELTRHSHDPLWYASALEGCACAFIAMADAGGHGVDEYLENNFQLPEEIMALAIAQGVAAGADLGDGRGKTMTVDRTKTTLPQAVTALVEEAMSVLCRHEKLAPLHAGLLMKLAEYVQEEEEGHLRCRWGEGEYCYGGDLNSMSGDYTPPRWERTSVSKLDLRGTEVREMLALDSIERGRKFTELLHRAVSVGGLDDRSRADVAAACARACLIGTRETQWGGSDNNSTSSRLCFPRKAAFFTLVGAEAMTCCQCPDAAERASSLYLAASHLYSRKGNLFEHGDGGVTRYGWATLRAAALQGLSSQPADKEVAEAATELLVALLNEISADQGAILLPQMHGEDRAPIADYNRGSFESGDYDYQTPFGDDPYGTKGNQSDGRPKQVSRPLATMTKTPFFAQAPPSALSLSQSKWLEDDPVPHIQLPFANAVSMTTEDKSFVDRASALSSTVASMSCVTAKINFEKCARVQHICMANIKDLRQQMGASSDQEAGTIGVYDGNTDESSLPPPLVVTSAKIVKGDSHLLLERTKALGYSAKFATNSMSTFFNPYAKNKGGKEKNKIQTTLIAEGEERTIMIEFKNRLAVPLEVPSCQLEFEGKGADRIEAPPLSFTVPAKTSSFAVHFPFIAAVSKAEEPDTPLEEEKEKEKEGESEEAEPDIFDVIGLRVTCLNRTFPICLGKSEEDETTDSANNNEIPQLPPSAYVYQRSKHTQPKKDEQQLVVRLESVPAQPNLLVSFAASQSPMEEDASVPVHLSDGEIFTIPPFRLENDFGRSGMGEIERLQVLAVGLPGIPDETLFDTDALAAALEEEEDVLTETDSEAEEEDFEEMMECDGMPPLKMKVIAEGLNLRSINDKSKNKGEGSIVKFQMAATHDMGDQLAKGGNVRIRFRYRGPSPNRATEIWRKREVSLRIIRVKGPRISSLTFRSDLSWGSSYTPLCNSLVLQRRRLDTKPKWESSNNRHRALCRSHSSLSLQADECLKSVVSGDEVEHSILNRVGMDQGVHVSSDEVVLLMAVANETNSTIILSNRKGLVGGFEGSPMPTVRITSGVSVKIPVVIPRIDRFDENCEVTDLATELVARTALQWESEAVEGADGTEKIKRTGRVRIPSRCLREIIDEHKSFASRICKPPVSLSISVGGEPNQSEISLPLGAAIQVDANMTVQGLYWCCCVHVSLSLITIANL